MTLVSYLTGTSNKVIDNQQILLHYQEKSGNIQELVFRGALSGWQTSRPIFTDARNLTGLASYTYMNGTQRTVSPITSSSSPQNPFH
jgi:hypothetical protein